MILIIDFGSQYNQLIARRVREHQVYCQIEPPDIAIEKVRALKPAGVILSGGPASIYEKHAPRVDKGIFSLGVPVLGICYGLQFMVDALGGEVIPSQKREYGLAELKVAASGGMLLAGIAGGGIVNLAEQETHAVDVGAPRGEMAFIAIDQIDALPGFRLVRQ